MADLVIASAPEYVDRHEVAFVDQCAGPDARHSTYSSILGPADCQAIDARSYAEARMWYQFPDGSDPTEVEGVSLGRAFEYLATIHLVQRYRAEIVLERLHQANPIRSIELRGASSRWADAAVALGLTVEVNPGVPSRDRVPASVPPSPPFWMRMLSAPWARAQGAGTGIGFLDAPSWSIPYVRALRSSSRLNLVNPGPRVLAQTLRPTSRVRVTWRTEGVGRRSPPLGELQVIGSGHEHLADEFRTLAPRIAVWASEGRDLARRLTVAIAAQDVIPASRATVLGLRAAGCPVVTLEHGISGGYTEQVHSVADVLGVWGEPHRAYHSAAGPSPLRIEPIGWPRLTTTVGRRQPRADEWDVVFFSQHSEPLSAGGWPEDQIRPLRWIDEYAANHPTRRVAVKGHPSSGAYGWTMPSLSHARLVTEDARRLVQSTKIVGVTRSTVGIEAMAVGTPVVQMTPLGVIGQTDFIAESGAATPVASYGALEESLETILNDPAFTQRVVDRGRAYARTFVRGLDEPGVAEHRLIELVRELGRS